MKILASTARTATLFSQLRSVARVGSVGQAGVLKDWCFTVEWLTRPAHYGKNRYSLNLFEEDLQDILRSTPAQNRNHGTMAGGIHGTTQRGTDLTQGYLTAESQSRILTRPLATASSTSSD